MPFQHLCRVSASSSGHGSLHIGAALRAPNCVPILRVCQAAHVMERGANPSAALPNQVRTACGQDSHLPISVEATKCQPWRC